MKSSGRCDSIGMATQARFRVQRPWTSYGLGFRWLGLLRHTATKYRPTPGQPGFNTYMIVDGTPGSEHTHDVRLLLRVTGLVNNVTSITYILGIVTSVSHVTSAYPSNDMPLKQTDTYWSCDPGSAESTGREVCQTEGYYYNATQPMALTCIAGTTRCSINTSRSSKGVHPSCQMFLNTLLTWYRKGASVRAITSSATFRERHYLFWVHVVTTHANLLSAEPLAEVLRARIRRRLAAENRW